MTTSPLNIFKIKSKARDLVAADAELMSGFSIGLEREYQKYNVLSTEDLTRHFLTMYIISYYTMV